jgi:arabinose-5-phosphate isomerase
METAIKVIDYSIKSLSNLRPLLTSPEFSEAVDLLSRSRVWTTAMGKAALAARKLSVTLSCNGISSAFMHAGEALHGDFGAIQEGDVIVAFSNSGKTEEVVQVSTKAKTVGAKLIVITGSNNVLSDSANIALCYGEVQEACPLGLTPTTSTLIMMAVSDAIAMCVQEKVGLTYDKYATNHHAGYLGQVARSKK